MKTINHKMKGIVDFLVLGQWYLTFVFCVTFGVIANESYLILKNGKRKQTNFIAKVAVSFFVCTVLHGYYEFKGYPGKWEPYVILVASAMHMQLARYMYKDLAPTILTALKDVFIKIITKNNGK